MKLLDRIFKRQVVNTAHPKDPVLADWFGGGDGVSVTAATALGVPAVYACVNVISETIAALPLSIWEIDGDSRTEAVGHPLYDLFHGRPAPHMTTFEFIEWLVSSTALRGDAFAEIVQNGRGDVTSLLPIPFASATLDFSTGRQRLVIQGNKEPRRVLLDDEVLRLPWKIQADGSAISAIGVQRESFATAIAARRYQKRLMENSATPKGAVKIPEAISQEAAESLIQSWERRHMGPDNAGRLGIFDGGMEWINIGMSNEDAQFAELMQMSLRDVARAFRVQPHKIGDLANATFSNIEHQSIEFMTDTILPWVRRIEGRMESWLLRPAERRAFSIEFNLRGLLRGDAAARSALYQALFYASAISSNEIRRMEGMNPVPGGDRYYVQQATVPTDLIDSILAGDTRQGDE